MKKIIRRKISSKFFLYLFAFSLITYSASAFKVGSIIWGDSLYYYAYTRSVIIDGDINFENEAYRSDFGFPNQPEISDITGKVINKFSPGSSLLWSPAFLLGHVISISLGFIGMIDIADGYNFLTQYLVAVSTIGFSIIGLYFVNKINKHFFDERIAFVTTFLIYIATQMFYYTSIDPLNSHSSSFMLSAVFLYLVMKFSKKLNWKKMTILGIVAGLIVLVRNQDLVVILPASIYLLSRKNKGIMEFINNVILFWGNVFLVFSIQIFSTIDLFGVIASPYALGGEKLFWLEPNFFRVLFSPGNGLFFFAPILMAAIYGLILILKSKINSKKDFERFSLGLISIVAFLLQLYVIASWSEEIIGGPYGSRMFISILPHLSIGLAFLLRRFQKYLKFDLKTIAIFGVLFANNIIQIAIMLINY